MDTKKKLEELNKESLQKLEDYVQSKKDTLKEEDHEKLHNAKDEWQKAWDKLMDVLIVLERLEI
ncbi:MAG: hypothetical protein LC128_09820 [Chitinophagales bacterium]|nr:hypothetical protein [Chitinophagales bacterium]